MGIGDKFRKKIKDSVPDDYKEVKNKEEEPVPLISIDEDETSKVSRKIDDVVKEQEDYIDSIIDECEQTLYRSEKEMNLIRKTIDDAERKIKIMKTVKNNKMTFDVSWLINRIGELKHSPDGWGELEAELFAFIEEEIEKK